MQVFVMVSDGRFFYSGYFRLSDEWVEEVEIGGITDKFAALHCIGSSDKIILENVAVHDTVAVRKDGKSIGKVTMRFDNMVVKACTATTDFELVSHEEFDQIRDSSYSTTSEEGKFHA
jgi:hypothetical protein